MDVVVSPDYISMSWIFSFALFLNATLAIFQLYDDALETDWWYSGRIRKATGARLMAVFATLEH